MTAKQKRARDNAVACLRKKIAGEPSGILRDWYQLRLDKILAA